MTVSLFAALQNEGFKNRDEDLETEIEMTMKRIHVVLKRNLWRMTRPTCQQFFWRIVSLINAASLINLITAPITRFWFVQLYRHYY